jgi:hypothetical protein
MITRRQAMTTNPGSPTLTAHDAGRVYAFRGLTCPAGATPICLRGYYEAEQEIMRAAAKPARVAVDLKHFFNGSATGRITHHRVRGASSIYRLMVRESGNGWGVDVWMSRASAKRLGVRVVSHDTVLSCKDAVAGAIPVSVYGHDYDDLTVKSL